MTVKEAKIVNEPLVPTDKIIIPPLHIKLGLMKQFVKILPVDGCCFTYICNFFPGMSDEKLKEGVYNSPQTQKIMWDPGFVESMTIVESATWTSFSQVIKNFLGNTTAGNYLELVEDMLFNFQNLGVKMSIKVHYLFCHLDKFSTNFWDFSEEQRKDSI